ncbi:MAG: carbohydrate ABC transporter permease, partial [Eubacteriales bacterium]
MAVSQRTAKKRRGSVYKNEEICGTIMASLPVIRFVLFGLAPMVLALVMAFFKMKKITSFEGAEFVWFENFKYIFTDPNFGTSIVNTLIYVLVLPVSIFLGLLIAAVLNSKVRGKGFFRVVVFLPYICSTVAIVYIWKWLYNYNYGIFNVLLGRQIPWLIDKNM